MKDSIQSIASGISIVFLGSIIGKVLELGTRTLLARLLAPSEFGSLMLGLTILLMATTVAGMGMQPTVARHIPQLSDEELSSFLTVVFSIPLLLSTIVGAFLFLFAEPFVTIVLSGAIDPDVIRIFSLVLPGSVFGNILIGYIRGENDMRSLVLTEVIYTKTSRIIFVIAAGAVGAGLLGFTAGVAASYVVFVGAGIYFARNKLTDVTLFNAISDINIESAKRTLSFSLPLFGESLIHRARREIDTLLVAILINSTAVGLYTTAFPLAYSLNMGLNAVSTVLMPSVSQMESQGNFDRIREVYNRTARWGTYITLPALPFILLYAHEIVVLFFGSEYRAAGSVLAILASAITVNTIVGSVSDTILGLGYPRVTAAMSFVGLVANVGLNLLLIPMFGITGAAIATGSSLVIINIIGMLFLWHHYRIHPIEMPKLYYGSVVTVFGGLLYLLSQRTEPDTLLLLFPIGFASYAVPVILYFVSGLAPDEDIEMLRGLISNHI